MSFSVAGGNVLSFRDLDNRFLPDLLMVLSGGKKGGAGTYQDRRCGVQAETGPQNCHNPGGAGADNAVLQFKLSG